MKIFSAFQEKYMNKTSCQDKKYSFFYVTLNFNDFKRKDFFTFFNILNMQYQKYIKKIN